MKRSIYYQIISVLGVLFQLSCTSQMSISTIKPAEVSVAYDQWKVVAVNRFNTDLLPFDRERKVEVFRKGAQESFQGAIDAILSDSTYYLVHADTLNYRAQSENRELSPEQVQEIYKTHPHHLLLSLDHFDTFFDQETVSEKNSDGTVSKTAHYSLVTNSHWTLYDSTGAVLDKATMRDAEHYQSRPVLSGLLAIGPAMGKAGTTVNKLAWYTGNDYWQRLSPQPITYTRLYYTSKKLQEAAKFMAAKEWSEAILLLQPLAERDTKGSAKAAYNLAVVYEASGNVQQARYWATRALDKNDVLAKFLLQDLDKYWSVKN